jgi:hypothetical protein
MLEAERTLWAENLNLYYNFYECEEKPKVSKNQAKDGQNWEKRFST